MFFFFVSSDVGFTCNFWSYFQHDSRDVPVRLVIGASGGTKIPTSVAQGETIEIMELEISVISLQLH